MAPPHISECHLSCTQKGGRIFPRPISLCLCVSESLCTSVPVCDILACWCLKARGWLWGFFSCSLPLFVCLFVFVFLTGPHWILSSWIYIDKLTCKPQIFSCLSPTPSPKHWGYRSTLKQLAFYVGPGDPGSGPHACSATILLIESSPQLGISVLFLSQQVCGDVWKQSFNDRLSLCSFVWLAITLWTRLASNSERSTCLTLPSTRIKGTHHHRLAVMAVLRCRSGILPKREAFRNARTERLHHPSWSYGPRAALAKVTISNNRTSQVCCVKCPTQWALPFFLPGLSNAEDITV